MNDSHTLLIPEIIQVQKVKWCLKYIYLKDLQFPLEATFFAEFILPNLLSDRSSVIFAYREIVKLLLPYVVLLLKVNIRWHLLFTYLARFATSLFLVMATQDYFFSNST